MASEAGVTPTQEAEQPSPTHTSSSSDSASSDAASSVNPTRDALEEGLLSLFRPALEQLEVRASATAAAQSELSSRMQTLSADLENISALCEAGEVDKRVEAAVEKLNAAKKRVVVVANVLQSAQDRLQKVHQSCVKETAKRRTLLEPSPSLAQ